MSSDDNVFAKLPEYPSFDEIKENPLYRRDLRFRSKENWGGELSSADEERLGMNLRLHGAIIDPKSRTYTAGAKNGSKFDPQDIADLIEGHWNKVRRAAGNRFIGTPILDVLQGLYQALVFGINMYCEGPSGTGKTEVMRYLASTVADRELVAEFNASSDATDFNLLGGETIISRGNEMRYTFSPGPLLKPGALTLMIDELPRLSVQTSNVLLDPMARRETVVPLVAVGRNDLRIMLSPSFFVTGVGNPIHYGGQSSERSMAMFDRFSGLFMPQPSSQDRFKMYDLYLKNIEDENSESRVPFTYTFREAQFAMQEVNISQELRERICAASFGISPTAFRNRVGWRSCPFQDAYVKSFQGGHKKLLKNLDDLVDQNLMEGSTPRGEIALLFGARSRALLDGTLEATELHVAQAFVQAHRARLKFLPGCEEAGELILRQAVEVYFPKAYSVMFSADVEG